MSHPSVALGTKEAKKKASVCGYCGASQREQKLFLCAACKSAQYCTKTCQKSAWKDHKIWCNHNRQLLSSLQSGPLSTGNTIGSLQAAESFQALQKWCHHHRPTLTWACHNAFEAKSHPERGQTHVFFVVLKATSDAQSGKETKPPKMFTVEDAVLMEKKHLALFSPSMGDFVAKADEQHANMEKGNMMKPEVSIMLVCCGSHVNLMPCFWERADLPYLEEEKEWKSVLKFKTQI